MNCLWPKIAKITVAKISCSTVLYLGSDSSSVTTLMAERFDLLKSLKLCFALGITVFEAGSAPTHRYFFFLTFDASECSKKSIILAYTPLS